MRYRALIAGFLAMCLGLLTACSDAPPDVLDRRDLTYEQILDTGIANSCPQLPATVRGSLPLENGQSYNFNELCLEPQKFFVKEEPLNKRQKAEFVAAKPLTRYTSSLEQMRGQITANEDGSLTLTEEGGIDFQPITVLLPGGEEVPFLFTIKNLVATTKSGLGEINSSSDFEGDFYVPSYRGAVFLDPKGRGVAAGYDNAVALPAGADADKLTRANTKRVDSGTGHISLLVTKVDASTGEVTGNFVSEQPSDTDLGADDPEEVKVSGIFYAQIDI